jgi:hypothetical protein
MQADTVTRSASRDTCLFELFPTFNWGAEDELVAGVLGPRSGGVNRCRILMGFDIGAIIPPGSTITAAELKMSVVRAPDIGAANATFQLLRVLRPWVEGNKDGIGDPGGATASPNEANWIHPNSLGPWTSPGGKLEVDYAEDPSASQLVTGSPAQGWVLLSENETTLKSARRWASSEHPTDPPELTVTFTPPPPPPIFEITHAYLDPVDGDLVVEFNSQPGEVYSFEFRTDLTSGDWIEVNDSIESGGTTTIFRTPPPAGTRRLFFRVLRAPF